MAFSAASARRARAVSECRRSQKEEWARVHGCYEVLEGCPFVPSRPLLTIALPSNSRDSEYGPAYALRTRRPMDTEESALARLLDLTTVGTAQHQHSTHHAAHRRECATGHRSTAVRPPVSAAATA